MALIGMPLKRRHSAVMHNAAFIEFGIDARYELIELDAGSLDGFMSAARGEEWLGFQVTAPHKTAVASRCDDVSPMARSIGAVNSVHRRADGTLYGFNTDAPGFVRSVTADLAFELPGSVVAVAGAGGAARAVVGACLEAGARRIVVGARSVESATELASSFDDRRIRPVRLGSTFSSLLAEVDLAVNATTVGMTSPGTAFDPGLLPAEARVFDLVYVPARTALLEACEAAGVPAVNGLGMLVAQAEIAFECWTGVADVGPIMRRALDDAGL